MQGAPATITPMTAENPRTFLIDTDTASDDAVALIMALRAPGVKVAGITTVAGNVDIDQATANALLTVELCAADVPVYRGAAAPLLRPLDDARWFHGDDGLGDRGYVPSRRRCEPLHAVDAILEAATAHPGLTVVTLGPLTNLALALTRAPELAERIGRLVVMGGAPDGVGNVTPAAEYNLWVDPEAARIVLHRARHVELVGWQLACGAAALDPQDIERVRVAGTALAQFAIDCNARAREAYRVQTGADGISLPDPVAMAIALDRTIGTRWSRHRVEVEVQSELTRGMSVVDRLGVAGDARNRAAWAGLIGQAPNTDICWDIDIARWKAMLYDALR